VRLGADLVAGKGWFGAFTGNHKLFLSPTDPPGFFDLAKDPNELRNAFAAPEHREEIRRLAKALKVYGDSRREPLMESAAVRADLDWALNGTKPYKSPPRPRRTTQASRGTQLRG